MTNESKTKLNGWLKILAIIIPLTIVGIVWAAQQGEKIKSIKEDSTKTEVRLEVHSKESTQKLQELENFRGSVDARLTNIEKMLERIDRKLDGGKSK